VNFLIVQIDKNQREWTNTHGRERICISHV